MKTKKFDCVQMKREGAKRVQEILKGMTREQQLAFWQDSYEHMIRRRQERRERAQTTTD